MRASTVWSTRPRSGPASRLCGTEGCGRVGASFDGHISGVTRAGLFVKLDGTGADGFVPMATLGSDRFRYHETAHALVGAATGETHRLGDRVSVRLAEAAPIAGALRFELLSEGRYEDRPRRRASASRKSRKAVAHRRERHRDIRSR